MQMKREEFLQKLESVEPGLIRNRQAEQEDCFVFKGGDIITYNAEVCCRIRSDLDITGAVCAAPLLELVRKLSADEIEVEATEAEFQVKAGKERCGVRMEKEILLPVQHVEPPTEFKPLSPAFSEALETVCDCAYDGPDAQMFAVKCVHISPKFLEATDLSQAIRFSIETPVSKATLVKRSSLEKLANLDPCEMAESAAWLHFRNKAGLVYSCRRSLETAYKDLSKLYDIGKAEQLALPEGLEEAVQKAEVFSKEDIDFNRVHVKLMSGKVRVKGMGSRGWYSRTSAVKYTGKEFSFIMSPKLLSKIAKEHRDCEVTENRLRVRGGSFVYIAALDKPRGETDES